MADPTDDVVAAHQAESDRVERDAVLGAQTAPPVGGEPLEDDDPATQARLARETVARVPRRRAVIQSQAPVVQEPVDAENPYPINKGAADQDGVEILERMRLNRQDAFYRGSVAGSTRLSMLAHWHETPDPPEATPEQKAVLKGFREEYLSVVADLAAYDQMKGFGTTLEAMAAFGGQLEGTMISPESWIGWGAKGATWLGRTVSAGFQQGAIQAVTDPAIQALNIGAKVQQHYELERTAMATAFGFGIGAGGHAISEGLGRFVGQHELRRQLTQLAQQDAAFADSRMAMWSLDPENGIKVEAPGPGPLVDLQTSLTARAQVRDLTPSIEPEPPMAGRPPTVEAPDVQGALSFSDRVKTEAERLAERDRYGRQPAFWQEEARRRLFLKEVGEDLDAVMGEYGFSRSDWEEVAKHYDRQAGQTPREAQVEAMDAWVEAETRTAIESIDGTDSLFRAEWEQFTEALMGDFGRFTSGRYTGWHTHAHGHARGWATDKVLPEFQPVSYRRPPPEQEIPFDAGETRGGAPAAGPERAPGAGGGAAAGGAPEPQAPGAAGARVEGGDAVGRSSWATGPEWAGGESAPRIGPEQVERLRQRMTAEDREEFDRVIAAGANSDQEQGAHVRRLLELRLKYTPFAERAPTFPSVEAIETWLGGRIKRDGLRFVEDDALRHMVTEIERLGGDLRSVLRNVLTAHYEDMKGQTILGQPIDEGTIKGLVTRDMANLQERLMKTVQAAPTPQIEGPREGTAGPLKTEQTDQGTQTLIPGVEPITARERLEAEMAKPKAGGDRPPPAGGLFDMDARRQTDMFGRTIPGEDEQAIAKRRKGGKMAGEPTRRPVAAKDTSPERVVAIRSLQQQVVDLAEALDIPVRQGRITLKNAAGVYNTRTGVMRVQEIPDFDIVIHEAGHAIEGKIGADMSAMINRWAHVLGPLDYDPKAGRPEEGFAEVVRWMVTNPAYAAKKAPSFVPAFRSFLEKNHPEILASMDASAVAYQNFLNAGSIDAVRATTRFIDEEPGLITKVAEAVQRDQLPLTIRSGLLKAYDAVLDDKAPMTTFVREMGKAIRASTGAPVNLKAADDPSILLRFFERSRQAATRNMLDGVYGYHSTSPEGPSLNAALVKATGQTSEWGKWDEGIRKDFSAYLVARRAEYLWRKYQAGEMPNPPVSFSRGDALQAMADLSAAHPTFDEAADMVHGYTRELLRKAYEGGLLKADRYAKLIEEEFYVPFMRDVKDKPISGTGMGAGAEGPGTTELVRRMRGSARDIIDPLESIMGQTFLIERTLAHNDIVTSMVKLSQRAFGEGGRYVEPVRAHEAQAYTAPLEDLIMKQAKRVGMDADEAADFIAQLGGLGDEALEGTYFRMERAAGHGEPIVFYRENGDLKAVRVMSKEEGLPLYDLLMQAPEPVRDIWSETVALAATVKRASITTNPTFMIANYIRDQFAAAILRPDYIPMISGMRGLVDEVRQGESARLYGYAGGVSGGASVGVVDRIVERNVDALKKKGFAVTRLGAVGEMFTSPSVDTFRQALSGLGELASFTEAGTRNSIFGTVFQQGKRRGLSDWEAMIEAAFQAQDLLDFSRHGSATLMLRRWLPFFNAQLQGLDKGYRTAIEPLINRYRDGGAVFTRDTADFNNALLTLTKFGAVGAAAGAAFAALFGDKEAYRDATPEMKGTHVVVPVGNRVFLIPKPFELGIGFTAGELAVQRLKHDDPRAWRMFREAVWDTVIPPNPIKDLPIVAPSIELFTGVSMFTKRDIVPEQLQRLPAEMQYTDRTSDLGKWIGKTIGVSPIKVDYAIGSQFATWGRDVMALSQGVSENAPAAALDDMVFFRRFVKDPTRSSDITVKFWEYMGQVTGKFNRNVAGYNDLVKEARVRGLGPEAAADFLRPLPAAEKAFVILKSGGNEAGKAAFTADERRLHPLQRSYDAVTVLNEMRRELGTNAVVTYGGTRVNLAPEARRLLLDNVRELAQLEMRNALVITGEGGYANRPVIPPGDTMAKIRAISPAVADEVATRYASKKIYSTEAIERVWPQLRDRLVRDGTNAQIAGLQSEVGAQGYQFSGVRVRRPGVYRQPIAGQP